jgi:hypothetical protein
MGMYRLGLSFNDIEECTVIKETEHFVTFISKGREYREKKNSEYSSWHKTWQDAYNEGEKRLKSHIEQALRTLDYRTERLVEFKEKHSKEVQNGLG